jgi:hypothetical protein
MLLSLTDKVERDYRSQGTVGLSIISDQTSSKRELQERSEAVLDGRAEKGRTSRTQTDVL